MITPTLSDGLNRFIFFLKRDYQTIKYNIFLALAVFIFSLSSCLLFSPKAMQFVVFSKGQAITSLAQELNVKGVSQAKQQLLVNRFVEALPKALEHYATQHKVVILSDKEVVAGAPNVTQTILVSIAQEMLKQNQGNKSHG